MTGISRAISGPSLTASFKYDGFGRRTEKTINGTTIDYVYDGWDIIQEVQGSAKTNYVRTLNLDEPLTRIESDGTVRHYVRDALGSTIALTDDTGVTTTTYTYDAFGNTTASGEASDNPFQYTGRENDGTGLYYYRARYYSPEMHRFINEDPIRLRGGINYYRYVHNNPINKSDPYGLCPSLSQMVAQSIGTAIGAVIGYGLSGGDPLGGAAGGAIGAIIGAGLSGNLTTSNAFDIAVTGALSGAIGGGFGEMVEGAVEVGAMSGMQGAIATGGLTGILDPMLDVMMNN